MSGSITLSLIRNLHEEIQTAINKIVEENNCYGVGAPSPEQMDKNLEIIEKTVAYLSSRVEEVIYDDRLPPRPRDNADRPGD